MKPESLVRDEVGATLRAIFGLEKTERLHVAVVSLRDFVEQFLRIRGRLDFGDDEFEQAACVCREPAGIRPSGGLGLRARHVETVRSGQFNRGRSKSGVCGRRK
jgi:hypothetical protein